MMKLFCPKKAELENQLKDIDKAIKDIDYREANQRAGYVYVISNIGAFGPDVYKIGMTRRLDPQDRVDELGDASVPFNFDVHAMIFSMMLLHWRQLCIKLLKTENLIWLIRVENFSM